MITRRGACPGLSTPLETGDGLLVRMKATAPIPLGTFAAFCDAADTHGNGSIEVSARGSLQVRGLTRVTAPLFARAVGGIGMEAGDGVPVIADALPGDPRALIDAAALAAELRCAITEAKLALAPKVSIVVDGGGALHLDALKADIRLRAIDNDRLHLALAGDGAAATPLGAIACDKASTVVLDVLHAIAARGPMARAADALRQHGVVIFRDALGHRLAPAAPLPPRPRAQALGRHRLKDGSLALGIALAFGLAQASELIGVISAARCHGAKWLRPAPDRAVLIGPLTDGSAEEVARAAEELGFIVSASDPRRRVVACPGAPFCASGLIPARALAAALAPHLPSGDGIALHISGCAKGCAHPKEAALTIVGSERGCGVVRNGTTRAAPTSYLDASALCAPLVQHEDQDAVEPAHA